MSSAPTAGRSPDPPRPLVEWPVIHIVCWALMTVSTATVVAVSFADTDRRNAAFNGRFFEHTKDSAPFLVVLLAAPVVWWSGRRRIVARPLAASRQASPRLVVDILAAFVIGLCGMLASRWFGQPFDGLPPAIHDEYSYLFQAQTFLAGRTWLPSFPEHPDLFDQMHVLNEGRFSSRYFPGTGAWLAPFVRWGNPWEGEWLANGLVAAGVFAVGRLISGRAVGIIAGLLHVVGPGMLVFSNMLVAHLPTMVGLIAFLWAILRCRAQPSAMTASLAGIGLAFAMLCRPMTAAGFALPFGIDWVWRLLAGKTIQTNPGSSGADNTGGLRPPLANNAGRPTLLHTVALGLPLVVGSVLMLAYNQSITGSAWISPYQQYTDLYTPRHVYGFRNVERGDKVAGPKTIEHYDRWAENLTPALAARNVGIRLVSSSRWTLGTIPLLFSLALFILDWRRLTAGWRLILASIISLHVVHIPYWYAGIMDWHYVFETGPLLLLVIAWSTVRLFEIWKSWSAKRLACWWGALIAVAVLVNDISIEPLWRSRVAIAQSEAMFSRARFGLFRAEAQTLAEGGAVIVFVKPDPTDLHMDYVTNRPTLDGPVLVARLKPYVDEALARKLFPDRTPYVFDSATRQWNPLASRL